MPSASAQSSDTSWTPPVNLSNSGSTSSPLMVVDSDGIIHVIWADQFAGYMYTKYDGSQWSRPIPVAFPFTGPSGPGETTPTLFVPYLIADGKGYIHAFWTDEEHTLYYSRVQAAKFGDATAWEARQALAESALDLSVAVDSQNNLHLSYIRDLESEAFPAGVYYRRSRDGGASWSSGLPLYQSLYFRSLTEDNSHVQIAVTSVADSEQVYVVWDNRPLKRIFLSKSSDGGQNWDEPLQIDGPEASSGYATPFNIKIDARDQNALLIWQVGEPGASCTQYFESSTDGGGTWSDRRQMLEDLFGCPQENQFFAGPENLTLLLTRIQDQIYLLAWDGQKWSEPQAQRDLSSFEDPITYNSVVFRCQQAALVGSDQLSVAGCDTGGGGDIWLTSRSLGDVNEWFPPPSAWSPPVQVADALKNVSGLQVVTDREGRVHAFWSQVDDRNPNGNSTAIYYARSDGINWSRPVAVLDSPGGRAEQPSIAIDHQGRLLVAYSDQTTGEIFFSWANAANAISPLEWADPQALPLPQTMAGSPDIMVDDSGTIYIAYVIPINEGRGVYLVSTQPGNAALSQDTGQFWSDPVKVFDGAAAGWQGIGQVHLSRTANGHLYLLWSRDSLPGIGGAQALYFASSKDSGLTWSEPESVVEGDMSWSQIVGVGERTVYRLWQTNANDQPALWYQFSLDSGLTWSIASSATGFAETLGPASLVVDPANQLHLIQAMQDQRGRWELRNWQWAGDRWNPLDNLDLRQTVLTNTNQLAATISPLGRLDIVYSGLLQEEQSGQLQTALFYVSHSLELPDVTPTPLPTLTPAPPPVTDTPNAVLLAVPTPTVNLAALALNNPRPGSSLLNSSWSGSIVGGMLAALLVAVAFVVGVSLLKGRRL